MPLTGTELLFASGMRIPLFDGLIFFQTDCTALSFRMKLVPDPLSRMVEDLLFVGLQNPVFA